ncbi:MAG: 2-amino-3,7-dideoxy-D-threo-hept-6-ulosonate synthase [bacterium]|nr:2-amino-3,7-dideoxy-D-threo-hept-6-ulosonate synthase [bacterium]
MIGKSIRMERIINRESKRTVIIPMDHGVTMGPISGLEDMREAIGNIVEGGANAVILHKGMIKAGYRGGGKDIGLIIHLSASTSLGPDPNAKIQVCTVKEALQLGADAVSVHINLGAESEKEMLANLGSVGAKCQEYGLPLIAMMYTRGKKVESEFDARYVKHAARVGAELGVDMVKVNYTGSPQTFKEVVAGSPIPVVIAGGEKVETDLELFEMIEGALKGGAAGVSIGRNAFQHRNPVKIVRAISKMVHENYTVEQAIEILK